MRIWMDSAHRQYSFPVLPDLRAKGVTDYLAFVVNLGRETAFRSGGRSGMLGSWATDDPAGFSEADIDSLLKIQDRLAVACKMAIKSQLMRNIAKTYLGRSAGKRVLSGQIKRGDGQSIKAAIWYADLRNSTAMADTLPRQDYIDTLNAYFDTTGGAVVEAGGEILSFIGDAVLAIFPTDGRPDSVTEACERALAAAAGSRQRMHVLNDKRAAAGKAGLDFGVGLHLGEVMYGNVGVPARLTFSVFGAAVNEVARLDQLTKSLGEPVLVTGEFAAAIEQPWRAAGAHALKGVGRKLKVFAPGWSALPAARKESATMMA